MRHPIFVLIVSVAVLSAVLLTVRPAHAGYVNCTKVANDVAAAYVAKHELGVDLKAQAPATKDAEFILSVADALPAGGTAAVVRKRYQGRM